MNADDDRLATLLLSTRLGLPNVHAEFLTRIDRSGLSAAHQRWERSQPRGSATALKSLGKAATSPGGVATELSRLWYAGTTRWRFELGPAGDRNRRIVVMNGEAWTDYHPLLGLTSGAASPPLWPIDELLAPAELVEELYLIADGTTTHAGRRALRARGMPQPSTEEHPQSELPWRGADEYALLIDEEVGVVLRLAGIFDGKEFASKELTQVEFGAPLPPDILVIEPPDGIEASRVTLWRRFIRLANRSG